MLFACLCFEVDFSLKIQSNLFFVFSFLKWNETQNKTLPRGEYMKKSHHKENSKLADEKKWEENKLKIMIIRF